MAGATGADLEDLAVGSSPAFRAIMERFEARYRAEGGLSTDEVRSRLEHIRRSSRRQAAVRKVRRKPLARRSRG
jgi:hypothetical protein